MAGTLAPSSSQIETTIPHQAVMVCKTVPYDRPARPILIVSADHDG